MNRTSSHGSGLAKSVLSTSAPEDAPAFGIGSIPRSKSQEVSHRSMANEAAAGESGLEVEVIQDAEKSRDIRPARKARVVGFTEPPDVKALRKGALSRSSGSLSTNV